MGSVTWRISVSLSIAVGIGSAQAPPASVRSPEIPVGVYERLFREVVHAEVSADKLALRGQADGDVRHFHRLWLGLSTDQETTLKRVAADWHTRNAPLEAQAATARTSMREERQDSPGSGLTLQKQALAAVSSQQVALAQSGRASLAAAFGPARMAYFESILRRYTVSKISKVPRPRDCPPQQCQAPSGETSQLDQTFDYATGVPNLFGGPWFGGSYEGVLNVLGGTDFTDRTLGEGFGGTVDTCYTNYHATGVPQVVFSSQTQPGGAMGAAWEVGTAFQTSTPLAENHYGFDYVYWVTGNVLSYIQGPMQQAARQGSTNPNCYVSATQSLYIDDCSPGEINYNGAPYQTQGLGFTITYNALTVCAVRNGISACTFVY